MNLNSLFSNSIKRGSQLINFQTVRRRGPKKPFWLGIAKSKKFIVPQPRVILTPEESDQNLILSTNYSIQLESLLNFIKNTNPKLDEKFTQTNAEGEKIYSSAFKAEVSKSLENNKAWNAESAKLRDKRIKEEQEKVIDESLKIMEIEEEKKKKEIELIDEVVRKEKLLSASYITPENLDKALENCLDSVENFDFAIDLKGNIYPGSEPLTPQLKQ